MGSVDAGRLKASIDQGLKALAAAVDEQAASEQFKEYLDFQARFHRYSWGNCWLIAMQRPDASFVAGFHRWKQLGRKVKKGERAIRIMAPCPIRRKTKDDKEDEQLWFKAACVFDVSQTEGKALPEFDVPEIDVQAGELLQALEQVATQRGITVEYRDLGPGRYGTSQGGHIEIASGHSTGQQAKSLAHELAHEAMHQGADKADQKRSRETSELEAESVAYVVCKHFGLDAELRASRYITLWANNAQGIAASLGRISTTAREMIEQLAALSQCPVSGVLEGAATARATMA